MIAESQSINDVDDNDTDDNVSYQQQFWNVQWNVGLQINYLGITKPIFPLMITMINPIINSVSYACVKWRSWYFQITISYVYSLIVYRRARAKTDWYVDYATICSMHLRISQWPTHHIGWFLIEVIITNCTPNTIVVHFYTSIGFAITTGQTEFWKYQQMIVTYILTYWVSKPCRTGPLLTN